MTKRSGVPHCGTCTCAPTTGDLIRAAIWRALDEDELTQAALAERAGITPKHLNQILQGHIDPRPEMADRIFAALGRRILVTTERQT
jgi:transcriptional regulator with XRE-family HTH domain